MRHVGFFGFSLSVISFPLNAAPPGLEDPSPNELLPATVEQGLKRRAIPILPEPEKPPSGYVPLFRLNKPYYSDLFAAHPGSDGTILGNLYRPSEVYVPLQGLLPLPKPTGLWGITPYATAAYSYDSNIELTHNNEIADHYFTPGFGFDFFLGTPDSIYNEEYESIVALEGGYQFAADLFLNNSTYNAINQNFQVAGRVGRDTFIVRPYAQYENITSSGLLTVERANRTERMRINSGASLETKFDEVFRWTQNYSYSVFDHKDDEYINFQGYRAYTDVGYRLLPDFYVFPWFEYKYTDPDRGDDGDEPIGGVGWQGKIDPRLFSELRIGYGAVDLDTTTPRRKNLSGLRFYGSTTFDWGPRLRLTVKYDRNYVYNELDVNDNYVATGLQLRAEYFLGEKFYLTPYVALTHSAFENSLRETIQIRPEIELAYAFQTRSRAFIRVGYEWDDTTVGDGSSIQATRYSIGLNYAF